MDNELPGDFHLPAMFNFPSDKYLPEFDLTDIYKNLIYIFYI
jgi:hypothetical protein